MENRIYYIVWNQDRSEGFITDSRGASLNAHEATDEYYEGDIGQSSLGLAFSELYREEQEDIDNAPEIERIEL